MTTASNGPDKPAALESDRSMNERAVRILRGNDKGGYTVPTEGMYPHQWNWDSAFVALGFATFDMDRAIRELETLFEAQWETGMVPQIAFRDDDPRYFPGPSVWRTGRSPASSGITQPPVAASIAWHLWRRTTETRHRTRLGALFPKLFASHRWFHTERDPHGQGVVVIIHPWESGRDNSPEWDAPAARVDVSAVEPYERRDLDFADAHMRPQKHDYDRYLALVQFGRDCGWDHRKIATEGPFRVADVGLSMMMLRANRDLAALAEALGDTTARGEIDGWITLAERGLDFLWDDNAQTFCARDLITGRSSGFVTSASFLAFYAGIGREEQVAALFDHWDRVADRVSFMVPSFDPDHPLFDNTCYWRGPSWAVVNYMLFQGLSEAGQHDRAERAKADTRTMIERHGFREAFSPLAGGGGTGGHDFSWTAAMWLAWASLPKTEGRAT